MKFRAGLAAGVVLAASVAAQPVPRIRARIVSFDGQVITLQPEGSTADADWVRVTVRPDTRYVSTARTRLSDIHAGDFAGAAVIPGGNGALKAQEVHVYPGPLRGSGEGRFAEGSGGRLMINGTVVASDKTTLTLHYRGGTQADGLCQGRAPVPITPTACTGDATIILAPGVPVTALSVGDKSLLVPGAMAIVSVVTGADGGKITPGLIVEKPQASP